MRNTIKISALLAAVALFGAEARAQFAYSTGDLLLNFRYTDTADGSFGASDVEIDLGNVNTFLSTHSASGTYDLTSLLTFPGSTKTLASINNTPNSGATLDGISFSATAVIDPGNVVQTKLWATSTRGSGPLVAQSGGVEAQAGQAIDGVGNGGNNSYQAVANRLGTANAVKVGDAGAGSYHTFVGTDNSGTFGGFMNKSVETTTPAGFTGSVAADLFYLPSGATAQQLGYFTFGTGDGAHGALSYTVSAVPEPASYGVVAGLGLLALAMRRQIRRLPTAL